MTFDTHLESCAQCRERPFDLCALGAELFAQSLADIQITITEIGGGPSQRMGWLNPDGSITPEPHPRPALHCLPEFKKP